MGFKKRGQQKGRRDGSCEEKKVEGREQADLKGLGRTRQKSPHHAQRERRVQDEEVDHEETN